MSFSGLYSPFGVKHFSLGFQAIVSNPFTQTWMSIFLTWHSNLAKLASEVFPLAVLTIS